MVHREVAFILAGGRGSRLHPLTKERAKPALPFGGRYRIVDFVLSNLVNSGICSIYVLTQYKSQSLLRHLRDGILSGGLVRSSILGRGVHVHDGAVVEESIVFDSCEIGRHARIRRAILDEGVKVPEDAMIGYDVEQDRQKYSVSESGIVVVEGSHSALDIWTK